MRPEEDTEHQADQAIPTAGEPAPFVAPTAEAEPAAGEPGTKPAMIAEGRGHTLPAESALAIAQASLDSGFPVPPQAAAAIIAAGLDVPTERTPLPETPAASATLQEG